MSTQDFMPMARPRDEPTAAREPTLAEVAREFPHWTCWHGISGMYLARHREAPPGSGCEIRGYDLSDLCYQITRAELLGVRR